MINYKAAPSRNNTAEMIRVLMPIIVIGAIFIIGKKFFNGLFSPITGAMEGLGIKDTAEEKKKLEKLQDNLDSLNNAGVKNPFDPNYHKSLKPPAGKGVAYWTVAKTTEICKAIYGAIGWVYDTPEQILGAIKMCAYKSQVSFVCEIFYQKYNLDLLSWLADKLDTTAQKIILGDIITYVNGLPSGIVSKN